MDLNGHRDMASATSARCSVPMVYRHRRLRKSIRVVSYVDESLRTVAGCNATDAFVQVYADEIPKTYGAPVREAVGVRYAPASGARRCHGAGGGDRL